MESKQEETVPKYVKAFEELDDFYMSSSQYCIQTGVMDPAEEGRRIEAVLQLALDDIHKMQKRLKDLRA